MLLRRLACPSLGHQPDPGVALYNPYVTVDYASNVPLNRGATNTGAGYSPFLALAVVNRKSYGRREPFDGREAAFSEQPLPPPIAGQPQPRHTFCAHNQPLQRPFQWLVHLDRPPVSPVELLLPPLKELFDRIKGLLVSLDVEVLFRPILDKLKSLKSQLADGLGRTGGAYKQMVATLDSAGGGVSVSVSVGT